MYRFSMVGVGNYIESSTFETTLLLELVAAHFQSKDRAVISRRGASKKEVLSKLSSNVVLKAYFRQLLSDTCS